MVSNAKCWVAAPILAAFVQTLQASPATQAVPTFALKPDSSVTRGSTINVQVPATTAAPYRLTTDIYEYQTNATKSDTPVARRSTVEELGLGSGNRTIAAELPYPGLFVLTATQFDAGGKVLARASVSLARLLPAKNVLLTDFGVVTHFGQLKGDPDLTVQLIAEAGFGRIRDELYWDHLEPTAGSFHFPPFYDRYVTAAQKAGLKPLIVLDYANARAYPQLFGGANGRAPRTKQQIQLFEAYVGAVVNRYHVAVKDWEIWNEPKPMDFGDEQWIGYTAFAKAVTSKVKSVDPNATVIACGGGGVGGGPGGGCAAPMLRAGAGSFADGFSIHPYMAPYDPDNGYPTKNAPIPRMNLGAVAPALHNLLSGARPGKPPALWATEVGWPSAPADARTNEPLQAAYVSRLLLQARRLKQITATFWYDFQDDGVSSTNSEHNFGLIRSDYSPKPSYVAAATTAATIANLPWSAALIDTVSVKAYAFGDEGSVIAAWTTTPGKQSVAVPVTGDSFTLRDWQGRETDQRASNGKIQLQIDSLPVFLIRKR